MTTVPLPMAIRKSLARNDARTARRLLKQLQEDQNAPEAMKVQEIVLEASINFKENLYDRVFAADISALRVPVLVDSMIGLKVSSRFAMGVERVELGRPWVQGVDRNYFTRTDWNSLVAVILKRVEVLTRNGLVKNAEALLERVKGMDNQVIQCRCAVYEHRIGCLRDDLDRASSGMAFLFNNNAPEQMLANSVGDFSFLLNAKRDLDEVLAEHGQLTAAKLSITKADVETRVAELQKAEGIQAYLDALIENAPETIDAEDSES